jgi:HK97 gp10 family phage protein
MARINPGRYLKAKGRSGYGAGGGNAISMGFEGGPELAAALRELGELGSKATPKNAMRRGLENAARPMVMTAKALAPKDDHELEASIQASTKLSPRQKRMAPRVDKYTAQVFVGPDHRQGAHGVILEFGTEDRWITDAAGVAYKFVGRITPHPFMRPAFDQQAVPVFKAFAPMVWAEIEKATKRIAKKKARAAK